MRYLHGPLRKGVILAFLLSANQLRGQQSDRSAIAPPDVYVHVDLVRNELEAIRFVMGRPKNQQKELGVTGAAPREVYFQVLTMYRKSDRLCFEHCRIHGEEPPLVTGEIHPGDVHYVTNLALQRLRLVKQKLGIDDQVTPANLDPSKTPTDVFRAAVQANRQLNLLLDRQVAPSDVFQQVTTGVGYAARLLEQFPEATEIPADPDFEVGKRPADVYQRLLRCFRKIREIAALSGLQMLELEVGKDEISQAQPSDVYDIASLLVSELAFLHSQLEDSAPPREVYFVGRKFPSHVYQRAGILELQLDALKTHVAEHPSWLNPEGTPP
ncbi:hypothetical protein FYK55_12735 [Roseiconus nitratireducens]|uniref:Uncharacterized protein n=1 Tax=Roseiconus nitratireducens TaxID=2605748 RepID=A0A5M6D6Z7_9BACT|nr:hypothetical protein [Roseiconus nitratireducens]KAA5543143.1 hypothetical protein FYK55_12735 [Roseiconus nitratireducens]